MSDVLIKNGSQLQRDLDAVRADRIVSVPDVISSARLSSTADEMLLPALAWESGVDYWDPDWTLEQKRDAILASRAEHTVYGTVGGFLAEVSKVVDSVTTYEELGGGRFRLAVYVDAGISARQHREINAAIARSKRMTAHAAEIRIEQPPVTTEMAYAAVLSIGESVALHEEVPNGI